MSRQPGVVAALSSVEFVVATNFSLQADVATASDAVLMSRLHPDVVTLCLLFLQFLVS